MIPAPDPATLASTVVRLVAGPWPDGPEDAWAWLEAVGIRTASARETDPHGASRSWMFAEHPGWGGAQAGWGTYREEFVGVHWFAWQGSTSLELRAGAEELAHTLTGIFGPPTEAVPERPHHGPTWLWLLPEHVIDIYAHTAEPREDGMPPGDPVLQLHVDLRSRSEAREAEAGAGQDERPGPPPTTGLTCSAGPDPGSVERVTEHSSTSLSPDARTEATGSTPGASSPGATARPDSSVLSVFGQRPIGRIPVLDVMPVVDGGARPTKSVVGELFTVSATVFREGHDAVNATVVLVDPDDQEHHVPMRQVNPGLAHWQVPVHADREGVWGFRVEGWSDPYGTWHHDGPVKVRAGVDVELMLEEGARVLERAIDEVERPDADVSVLNDAITRLRASALPVEERLQAGLSPDVERILTTRPLRDHVSASPTYSWWVERPLALTGAWYEIFPRSEGARLDPETGLWTTGTFRTAAERLPGIAAMGFDVVYLTPVHPIGTTNRKGKNNTLTAEEHDPGSPYAIGAAEGGHDALHPDLGGWDDFDAFVQRAEAEGLEVALDIALQASPDHPWASEHPEFFTTRADGTIAYAENPPKKYQDIYPLNFDNAPETVYAEVRRVIQVWIDHGVKIFRVDNPHTKPVEFWQWLIADVAVDHPEVIWLSEAFTKPMMMRTLAKVGFQQSYTYFAWRNTSDELRDYVTELATETAPYMRPSFWPTTHDILTPYMQTGGVAAHLVRSALAATLVPTYGIYTGFEHVEHVNRPGAEEHIDNEKYEFKDRRWGELVDGRDDLTGWLTMLNRVRRQHPSLHWLRNITFHSADDENFLVYSKHGGGADDGSEADTILVVANLDPHQVRQTALHLNLPALGLGLGWGDRFSAHDLVTGSRWTWDQKPYVRLGPGYGQEPVHIIHVTRN